MIVTFFWRLIQSAVREAKKQGTDFAILKCKKLLLDFRAQLFLDLGVENVVLNVTVSSSPFFVNGFIMCF